MSHSAGVSSTGPVELRRERVGAFDVATIDPGDGSGLGRWLDEHGFVAPPAVDAVATDYARRGWVFVAASLTTDAASADVRRVHPLAFTFPAKEAVYPMRLTLAANPECAVELFVFHGGTAAASGMQVEFSETAEGRWSVPDSDLHREILRRAGGEKTLTKLVGTLRPDTTRDDLVLRFDPPRLVERVYYDDDVAVSMAATPALWTGIGVWLVASIAAGLWRRGRRGSRCAGACSRSRPGRWRRRSSSTPFSRRSRSCPTARGGLRVRRRAPRTEGAQGRRRRDAHGHRLRAPLHGGLRRPPRLTRPGRATPREEDSPGNYTIRETDGRLEVVTYDGAGYETTTDLRSGR